MEKQINYKHNTLKLTKKGIYKNKQYEHILAIEDQNHNFMKNIKIPPHIKLHIFHHHLNSSQVMYINYFAPFLETKETKNTELQEHYMEFTNRYIL